MKSNKPNYLLIYHDLIRIKYPEKLSDCQFFLNKDQLSILDVIKLNNTIFGSQDQEFNQKLRSYDLNTIKYILDYQIKNKLNNSQLALHFKISRNTVTRWKKLYNS
ncbi:transposase [Chryseobacterium kwangjuense]|uniref:Transposase n=1 Tax=Chryseobacterium kwangjuense TaxID=267125 RepID=A0A135W279_9FLAO|nr:transposase [Chryseobacterium kwangjuense]